MAGPKPASVRQPAVAGIFYPDDPDRCRALAQAFIREAPVTEDASRFIGGIVPHAGWICSGAIAGQTIAALAHRSVDVLVVFGAIHSPVPTDVAALDSHGRWHLPGGDSIYPASFTAKLTEENSLFAIDDRFHLHEHAVEVELPLIQVAWPDASVLPIEVPVLQNAAQIGMETARRIDQAGLSAVYLASSDLTHYGPSYRFTPAGIGRSALEWAKENDRRLLQLVTDMQVEAIVPEVRQRSNACGGGAIAAMLAACREMGAKQSVVLRHANSFETLAEVAPQRPENAVGYAAVVVG